MSQHVTIIAEAGVNHNGDIEKARELVRVAAEAGADYVKFQTFKAEALVAPEAPLADYQKSAASDAQSMLKSLELSEENFRELAALCQELGIGFLSTGFDPESIDLLLDIGMDLFKISSGEVTNRPYLVRAAGTGLPIVLSTGMCTMEEVQAAVDVLKQNGADNITVLHCTTEYPAPVEEVNLNAMQTMANALGTAVGYSDHTMGTDISIAAVAMGAVVIEKHFTLDRNLPGPDHKASLEPEELKAMVASIRKVSSALGNGEKAPAPSEQGNIAVARKSIHLKSDKSIGDVLSEDDIVMLRPGDGISPMALDTVIGRQLNRDCPAGYKLKEEDLSA